VTRVAQPILDRVFDFSSLVFGFLPSDLTVVAVILIRVECQKGGNRDCENYYDCRPHDFTNQLMVTIKRLTHFNRRNKTIYFFIALRILADGSQVQNKV
jgi:hypothetical protein